MALLGLLASSAPAQAADGDLDAGFGNAGQVMVERPRAFALAQAYIGDLATLADGRTLWIMEDGAGGATLMRLQAEGLADPGFGVDGQVAIQDCVAAGPTRIVAAVDGSAVVWTGACLRRLDNAGQLDAGFATGAKFPSPATAFGFRAAGLLRDHQGGWLLAGLDHDQWQVWRFLPDGGNDPGFGTAGMVTLAVAPGQADRTLQAMVLRPDGRIVLAGSRRAGSQHWLLLMQLMPDGTPDPSFATQGLLEIAPPAGYQGLHGEAVLVDTDGSIVVAGSGRNGLVSCCVLVARVAKDGSLAPDAVRLHSLGAGVSLSAFGETSTSLALLPDRQLLLARNSFPPFQPPLNTRTRFTLLRLQPDGTLDPAFGEAGWRSYLIGHPTQPAMGGAYSQLHGMRAQGGQVLLFGRTFFEDGVGVPSYVSVLRTRFDSLLRDGFEP